MRFTRSASVTALLLSALACEKTPPPPPPPAPLDGAPPSVSSAQMPKSITDRDWVLVALGERTLPVGAGTRPATLRLDAVERRAAGFSGCNRFSGQYTLNGDSLSFGPIISTKMFCEDGDALERGFLSMLSVVSTYEATDSTLTLRGSAGPVAHFSAAPPAAQDSTHP